MYDKFNNLKEEFYLQSLNYASFNKLSFIYHSIEGKQSKFIHNMTIYKDVCF